MQTVSVSTLVANPFRELDDYPIDRDKVDALKESIESTGFWGTIVARKQGKKFEIAFGHHRMVAMQELGLKKCEIIVRDLSNEDMVQMMARENLEEWGTNAYIEAQTVESTIKAYGVGDIELPEPERTDAKHLRTSPGARGGRYTMASVASFLGWTKSDGQPNQACRVAFEMIDAFDSGVVTRKQLRGVKRDIAREIVTKAMSLKREQDRIAKERAKQAEEAEKAAELEKDEKRQRAFKSVAARKRHEAEVAAESSEKVAQEFAKDAVKQTKSGNWSQRDVRKAGAEEKAKLRSKSEQQHKQAQQYYAALERRICKFMNERVDDEFKSLVSLLKMDCGLSQKEINSMLKEVEASIKRAEKFADKLRAWEPPKTAESVDAQLRIVG
jgi:hypothetical protein